MPPLAEGERRSQELALVIGVAGHARVPPPGDAAATPEEKLVRARAAAAAIARSLQPGDRLHIVSCSAEGPRGARLEAANATADREEYLLKAIEGLRPPAPGVAPHGADLVEGLRVAAHAVSCGGSASVKRIFLLSDGLVPHGPKGRTSVLSVVEELQQCGTLISAFGVGADQEHGYLLPAVARAGRGELHELETPARAEVAAQRAEAGARGLFGVEAELWITAHRGTWGLYAFGHRKRDLGSSLPGGSEQLVLSLGTLPRGQTRDVLVDAQLPMRRGRGPVRFLSYEVSYRPIGGAPREAQLSDVYVNYVPGPCSGPHVAVALLRRLEGALERERGALKLPEPAYSDSRGSRCMGTEQQVSRGDFSAGAAQEVLEQELAAIEREAAAAEHQDHNLVRLGVAERARAERSRALAAGNSFSVCIGAPAMHVATDSERLLSGG